MNAFELQSVSLTLFVKTIVTMLGSTTVPSVELIYDGATAYSIEQNVIRFKAPFFYENQEHVRAIAHECYHAYEFGGKAPKMSYTEGDRQIIEQNCSEYEYKYDFEKRAEVFSCAFANFFIKEVVGYNYKELYPTISREAKNKYPELISIEATMLQEYIVLKEKYKALFQKNRDKLIEMYSDLHGL